MRQCNVRNIKEYNKKEQNKIPYLFVFVDELSYLIKNEQIEILFDLARCSYFCGVYFIVGTSDVSFDKNRVLCGAVKANFINRICFAVDLSKESKLVLDSGGAENLDINEILVSEVSSKDIIDTKVSLDFGDCKINKDVNNYKKYLFFEIETTGLYVEKDKIIKFYYLLTDREMNIEKQEEFFINTGDAVITEEVSEIVGISQNDIDNGKSGEFLADLLRDILNKDTLAMSYNLRFTKTFLIAFLRENGLLDILNNVDCLDIFEVFKTNEKDIARRTINDAAEFYKIGVKCDGQNEPLVYCELFKKMKILYNLSLFIRQL